MSKSFGSFVRGLRNGVASLTIWGCLTPWRGSTVARSRVSASASVRSTTSPDRGAVGTPSGVTVPLPTYGEPWPLTRGMEAGQRTYAVLAFAGHAGLVWWPDPPKDDRVGIELYEGSAER